MAVGQKCVLCALPITEERNEEILAGSYISCREHEALVDAIGYAPSATGNVEAESLIEAEQLGRMRVESLSLAEIYEQGRAIYESIELEEAMKCDYCNGEQWWQDHCNRIIRHKQAYLKAFD